MKIEKVIRKYRQEKDMTQEEMAHCLGVSTTAVNKGENDNSYPDIIYTWQLSAQYDNEIRVRIKQQILVKSICCFITKNYRLLPLYASTVFFEV